jgi:hypothetical protein
LTIVDSANSGAKALQIKKDFIAALEALRHPKASVSANGKAEINFAGLKARLEAAPFQRMTRS